MGAIAAEVNAKALIIIIITKSIDKHPFELILKSNKFTNMCFFPFF